MNYCLSPLPQELLESARALLPMLNLEESEAGVVTPRYQLPNGDSVDPATVHKTEGGLTYIDYNITYTHYYNASRTYLVDEETYAVVLFTDEFYDPTSPETATVAHVLFLRWDTDTNYENDILVKEELYRLPDVFLLSKMEFSYSNGANNELALTGGSGLDYDEYYDRYNYVYCEYDSRFNYPKRYPTHYIQYEGDSNRVIVTWYYSYDVSGVLIWDGTADSDGILRNEDFYEDGVVVKSEDHFPDEGYDIVTEFENGQKKVSYQTFKGHKKHKDGTVHVKYYTDNVATHYDVIDPQGVRLRTVYYDADFNPGRIVYYNKDGSISREEVFD